MVNARSHKIQRAPGVSRPWCSIASQSRNSLRLLVECVEGPPQGRAFNLGRMRRHRRRKLDRNDQAVRRIVFRTDGTAVKMNDALADGEADSGAPGLACSGLVDPIERLEEVLQRRLGHPRA